MDLRCKLRLGLGVRVDSDEGLDVVTMGAEVAIARQRERCGEVEVRVTG